jgi:hypothetical protein
MTRALSAVLNESNPNKLADAARELPLGSALGLVARTARVTVVAGTGVGVLPEAAKVTGILRCFVSAGGVSGAFTPVATNAAPATTQVGLSATGNLQFLIADAVTEAEVTYFVAEGVVREESVTVTAQVGALPFGIQAKVLVSVFDTTVAATPVAKTVVHRSNAPAVGQASISVDGSDIRFGDVAVTRALVRYVAFPTESVDTALQSTVGY